MRRATLCSLGFLGLFTACGLVGRDYVAPEFETPPLWTAELAAGLKTDELLNVPWWHELGDPQLGELVEGALAANLDLRTAFSRINESRARYGIVTPELYPTVDFTKGYTRDQQSSRIAGGEFIPRVAHRFDFGVAASWELDFFGRIRRQIEAAEADIGASVEEGRAVLLSVAASVARAYVQLREAEERARITMENIAIQTQSLELTQARFEAGLVSELDVAQAKSIVEQTRSNLPPLEIDARAARNRLAVLLGKAPGALDEQFANKKPLPSPPLALGIGMPADLLRRRPDLRQRERELAAQTARIGVAEGDLYPRLTLDGRLGGAGQDYQDLFNRAGRTFGVGPNLTFNLWNRDRLHAAVTVEDERAKQALITYENALLIALEEVENAMTGFVQNQEAKTALSLASAESRRAVELSREQYRQGLVSFQTVLDSQARLIAVDDAQVRIQAQITLRLIDLYLALGGGWESRDVILAETEETSDPQ